ncbi:hypothetical protein L9F63_025300 [Diploptera punctata]|uniref:Uncharacterized protein n=1 Tax=Diploptera punctata TaxID=6984 RepID=A0AAD7ZD84_DIPPU|nr:hypothetical protein L9F63_025300 [Diploptera punctata]
MLPHPLRNLAIEALGEFVSQLFRNADSSGGQVPDHVVSHLEQMIATQVPPNMANQVTEQLLMYILLLFDDLALSGYMRQLREKGSIPYRIRCESVKLTATATIHPLVTIFNYNLDYGGHLSSPCIQEFLKSYLQHLLLKIKNLRVLKLRAIQFDSLLFNNCDINLQNLQEFAYNFCTDNIVQTVSSVSNRLRVLDIRESPGVTNVSVGHILKFRELKVLRITNTNITTQGVTGILKGIPQESCYFSTETNLQLDLIEFNAPFSEFEIGLVSESFKNLVSLELSLVEECSLTPLSSLTRLKSLALRRHGCPEICVFPFVHVVDLLRNIGHQLEELQIINLNGTNLKAVAVNCPALHTLVLKFPDARLLGFWGYAPPEEHFDMFPLPEFPSVRCLDVKLSDRSIVETLFAEDATR